MLPPLKISKKHHNHLNNPFPSPPASLPFIHGTLSSSLPNPTSFQLGHHFLLHWSPKHGGLLSISHTSQRSRPIWASAPGEAFLSAASVHTEVEESRGSFAIKDGEVSLLCDHQSIDEIRALHQSDIQRKSKNNHDFLSGFLKSGSSSGAHFPILLITGWVFSKKYKIKSRRDVHRDLCIGRKKFRLERPSSKPLPAARYWSVLEEKNSHQVGFHVEFGEFSMKCSPRSSAHRSQKGFGSQRWKLVRVRKPQFSCFLNPKRYLGVSSDVEERGEEERGGVALKEFNRVFITYSSERDERFYGFGEQFSHMEFKGRRVPILVQEQGIGRGDQPITFAANLVSYRYKESFAKPINLMFNLVLFACCLTIAIFVGQGVIGAQHMLPRHFT